MKTYPLLLLGVLSAPLLVGDASASDTGRFFVFGEIAVSDVERATGVADQIDGDATGYTLGAGYSWSQYFAARIGYRDIGEIDATVGCPPDVLCISIVPFATDEVQLDGFVVELLGSYPLPDTPFAITGKLGLFDWDLDWRDHAQLNDNGSDLQYGIGLRWSADDRWSAHLGLERSRFETNVVVGGLSLRF